VKVGDEIVDQETAGAAEKAGKAVVQNFLCVSLPSLQKQIIRCKHSNYRHPEVIERLELLAFTPSRARGQFMRIIALFDHSSCVLTRFGVIISGQDVNSCTALRNISRFRPQEPSEPQGCFKSDTFEPYCSFNEHWTSAISSLSTGTGGGRLS
jgi:hypothetical protein